MVSPADERRLVLSSPRLSSSSPTLAALRVQPLSSSGRLPRGRRLVERYLRGSTLPHQEKTWPPARNMAPARKTGWAQPGKQAGPSQETRPQLEDRLSGRFERQ